MDKSLDKLAPGRETISTEKSPRGETKMSMGGSAHYEGLLPREPSGEAPSLRPTILENDQFLNGQPSLRRRASRALSRFLIAFCIGVAATLAWQWYGDAAREMIANSYPHLGWLAPRALSTTQNAPSMIGLAAPAAPSFDQQQLNAMSLNIDAMRQSVDRIAAGHEQIMRSIDQIATSITTGQEQTTRSTDQTATNSDPPAKASGITVESRADGASVRPTARLGTETTEAKPLQTLPERGKQLSAASGHDRSCFPSASAVLEHHQGASWTLKAPGHEGTMCWYASARLRARDHRGEIGPKEVTVGTTENGLSSPPPPFTRAPE